MTIIFLATAVRVLPALFVLYLILRPSHATVEAHKSEAETSRHHNGHHHHGHYAGT